MNDDMLWQVGPIWLSTSHPAAHPHLPAGLGEKTGKMIKQEDSWVEIKARGSCTGCGLHSVTSGRQQVVQGGLQSRLSGLTVPLLSLFLCHGSSMSCSLSGNVCSTMEHLLLLFLSSRLSLCCFSGFFCSLLLSLAFSALS